MNDRLIGVFRKISPIVALASLVGLSLYIAQDAEALVALKDLTVVDLLLLSGIFVVFLAINGIFNSVILKSLGVSSGIPENINLAVLTNAANLVLPGTSGAAIRAIFLKKKYEFPYSSFIGSLAGTYVLNYFLVLSMALMAIGNYYWFEPEKFNLPMAILIMLAVIGFLTIIILSPWLARKFEDVTIFGRLAAALSGIASNPKLFVRLGVLILCNIVLGVLMLKICIGGLGVEISLWDLLFLSSINSLSFLIKITPGNIGITDTILGISGAILGYQASILILCSLILRAVNFLVAIILLPICCLSLFGPGWISKLRQVRKEAEKKS